MSEVTFAKAFLTQLDRKPTKLPGDYVSDPRSYPSQSPYTLPRQSHPFPERTTQTASTSSASKAPTVSVTLKPTRAGTGDTVTLADISPVDTSIYDLKTKYAVQVGLEGQQDKIKLLLNKKPAADLKTLQELGVKAEDGGSVEFSVMILGGAATTPRSGTPAASSPSVPPSVPPPAHAPSGDKMDVDSSGANVTVTGAPDSERAQLEADQKDSGNDTGATSILKTDEFWSDLQGFLAQRLKDEGQSQRLVGVFRKAAAV
ncbi:hypothetical protein K431DRAFT_287401 [Polychaeton citri CBS 116435]|uniref:Ubiquitin-like domain-containing protein n=1 Tax=Polychaeton citri CBS 116435 TaxID=1314669 RepID=A0A9P4Q149_9PEZI|nr:hypothetical protein K431DRAFT_287401 [Polychaeton citri CBS 116435]